MGVPWMARALTTLAFCWRIDRRDGVTIGFTSHDRDLAVDGIVYRAAPGMVPSAIALSSGFDPDSLDIAGALTSDAITAGDLAAGRWDGAQVALFACDWDAPAATVLPLCRGTIGAVGIADNGFTAELRGETAALGRPAVPQTSPECRAELGDRACRVDLAPRSAVARVVAGGADGEIILDTAEPEINAYGYGRLRWLDGANGGLASAILRSAGATVTLREPPPFPVSPGTRVALRQGCDKRLETCRDRFANAVNFRGEPFLPGNDLLTRYPGS